MAGELLIQVMSIDRFQAIRPALDELEAARALGADAREVLRDAAASPLARKEGDEGLAGLLDRILRHPELELRVFLTPRDLDEVILGVVHALCFENGAEFSLVNPVGPSWVVIESEFPTFLDLDWFRATFCNPEPALLAYPRRRQWYHCVLTREEVARVAAGVQSLLEDRDGAPENARSAAEGLAHLAAEALSREDLTLAHLSLL